MRRLHLYTVREQAIFTPEEALATLNSLDDVSFWLSDAQVEIMRLLTGRWHQFGLEDRSRLELRVRDGLPRTLFAVDAFENEASGPRSGILP